MLSIIEVAAVKVGEGAEEELVEAAEESTTWAGTLVTGKMTLPPAVAIETEVRPAAMRASAEGVVSRLILGSGTPFSGCSETGSTSQ